MAGIEDFIRKTNSIQDNGRGWSDPRDRVFAQDAMKSRVATQQPSGPGGLVGFLQDAGKSIGADFLRIGKGTANLLHEATGGAQQERDQFFKSQEDDINTIRALGEKMRAAKTDEERERIRGSLSNILKGSDQLHSDFVRRQDEIKEENDPTKGAAAVAGIGLDVLGAGTGGSVLKDGLKQAIARGAGQGAIFGGAQGALEPLKEKGAAATAEDIGGNAASGAGLGALGGAAVGGGLKLGQKILRRGGATTPDITTETTVDGKPSSLQRIGRRLTEAGSGLKADSTPGGVANLDRQAEFMTKYTGTPRQQRIAMEKDMGDLSKQVDEVLAKTPTKIDGGAVGSRVRGAGIDLADERFSDLDINQNVQNILNRYGAKFDVAADAKGINDIVKSVNRLANKANVKMSNPNAAPLTAQETAALVVKRAGDDALSEIPEIRPLKQNMAQIFEVTPQVSRAGDKSVGITAVSGLNSKAASQAIKGGQSKLGALLQGRGKKVNQEALKTAFVTPDGTPSAVLKTPETYLAAAANPTISRGAAAAEPETPPIQEMPSNMEGMASVDPTASMDLESSSAGIQAQLQAAALQALASGDGKGLENIMKVASLFESSQPKAEKPLSAEASKIVANANSGLKSLDQLRGIIDKQGGVSAGTLVPGRDLFGNAGANILGTASFDTAAKNVLDVITRLRTGAALTESEEAFYKSQIPQAFDSPEVRAQKLQMFEDLFGSVASRTGTAGNDTQALLGM